MTEPSPDPSVHEEPHLRGGSFEADPSEEKADRILQDHRPAKQELVEHNVWDEPALSPELSGPPPRDALTYANWLQQQSTQVTPTRSWLVTIALALLAGPWAVLGALLGGYTTGFGVVLVTVVGPLCEEVMKSAAVLCVIERRPYLLQSPLQIMFALVCGAFGFSAIENVIYLNVYIDQPSAALAAWRWSVCVALHVSCTAISGIGLLRVWRQTMTALTRPELSRWFPFLLCAALVHGLYNASAVVLEWTLHWF